MSWTKIRRFLRDPDGNIWDDNVVQNLYNDERNSVQNLTGYSRDVRVVRVPCKYYAGYLHDIEWPWTDHANGPVYQAGYMVDEYEYVCMHKWEPQHLAGYTPSTSALGPNYTQPWEGYLVPTPAEPPPIRLPDNIYRARYVAFDKEQITPIPKDELQNQDPTYRSRGGRPEHYYKRDELNDDIILYPRPSWATVTSLAFGEDLITFGDDLIVFQDTATEGEEDPDSAEYGSTDALDLDNNLLVIFDKEVSTVSGTSTDSDFPRFVRKYAEHGTISRCYRANTDGHIESLADYWEFRKATGLKALKRFVSKRKSGIKYCLETKPAGEPRRLIKHPRLPSTYPPV